MMRLDAGPLLALLLMAAGASCAPTPAGEAEPGRPLPELREDELARFLAGQALFDHVFSPEEGLGPLFNENQCSACHTFPASGGTGEQLLVRAARIGPDHACDPLLDESGDNVRQQATPALRAHGVSRASIPAAANAIGRFTVPFLYGLGLVEAIPDETILARADPDDADGDGISGRAARDAVGRVARFGHKAEHATILGFTDGALRREMGLTTPLHPDEALAGGPPPPTGTDPVGAGSTKASPAAVDPAAEPEVDQATIELLVDYVRFLAPPARRSPAEPADRELVERGERLFHQIGCAACHVPSMTTGTSEVQALDRKRVYLYSDLLLHDLGPELASVCGGDAAPAEYRTAMLMGLAYRDVYLHDGRALSVLDAILRHGGEATRARAAFVALGRVTQEAVLRYLRTL